jgi:selenocysteine lyase/cysteine desulfurase
VSFTIAEMEPGEVGRRLDEQYGVASRVGLHCSPIAHETIGTYPIGTVRFSLGAFSTEADVACALEAVRGLARAARR